MNNLEELQKESIDLYNKIISYHLFINSSVFKKYDIHAKLLMRNQFKTMKKYLASLDSRINYLKGL